MKLYMAYNHNGVELLKSPAPYEDARQEADDYTFVTANAAYVECVVDVDDAEYRDDCEEREAWDAEQEDRR